MIRMRETTWRVCFKGSLLDNTKKKLHWISSTLVVSSVASVQVLIGRSYIPGCVPYDGEALGFKFLPRLL
jgi:hypothetical protein